MTDLRKLRLEELERRNYSQASGDLKSKINGLVANGTFLRRDADYLHPHRFLGNEAVHELTAPPIDEFEIALKILEHSSDHHLCRASPG